LPEAKVELVERVYEAKPLLGPDSMRTRRYLSIETPMCEACRMGSAVLQDGGRPKEVTAPAFLGARDAWFWVGWKDQGGLTLPWMMHRSIDERLDSLSRERVCRRAYYVPRPKDHASVPAPGRDAGVHEPEMNAPEE
jgi:hypothetical protein